MPLPLFTAPFPATWASAQPSEPSTTGGLRCSRRQLLLAGLAGAGLGGLSAPADAADLSPLALSVRRAARQAVAGGLVGAVFGAVTPTQRVLGAAGLRQLGSSVAMRSTDFLSFGSNEKAMTAMTLAQLVARGTLSWDTSLSQALPELAAGMRPVYANVTLSQLLDHRGGVAPFNGSGDEESRFIADLLADPNPLPDTLQGRRRYAARWVLAQTPQVRPGRFLYSNAGYMLAAVMAEARTGRDFETLMAQHLAQPLQLMLDTRPWEQRPARYPQPHEGQPGALSTPEPLDELQATWLYTQAPSGDYACTGTSYADWLAAMAAGLRGERSALPASVFKRLARLEANHYALGWACVQLGAHRVLFHTGAVSGFMAEVMLAPDGRWAMFGVSNTAQIEADGSSWVLNLINKQLTGKVLPALLG